MAKKRTRQQDAEAQRQSRKDVLRARKEAEQTRIVRFAVAGVVGLLALVFLVAVVNEVIITPGQAVATVNDEAITMRQWQDRVRYERAQRIISLENQLEALGGDVGIIQQFAGQTINELLDAEALAENVLRSMTNEVIIRQEAEARGIIVTDADVDAEIGSFYNYFDGESPTPLPVPTETIAPTPSLTPIPTAVITEVVPANTPFPTIAPGPTADEPLLTATPVSKESFEEQLGDLTAQFRDLGVSEEIFREVVRIRLYRDRLAEALAEESNMPAEAEHASFYLLTFDTEASANEAWALIQAGDFLTVWNTIRSAPSDPEAESTARATEILWRTQDSVASSLGEQVSDTVFVLPPNVPSAPIAQQVDAETSRFHIVQVSGLEMRQLPEATVENNRQQLVNNLVVEGAGGVELTELWRSRVPAQPLLDPKFLVPPTPAPAVPDAGSDTGSDDDQ